MGILNNLKLEILKTHDSIKLLENTTTPRNKAMNRVKLDALNRRLRTYQSRLENLGIEHIITKVTLRTGKSVYFTGLDATETRELVVKGYGWEYLAIVEIIPGKEYAKTIA